jgi:hypothetical protein
MTAFSMRSRTGTVPHRYDKFPLTEMVTICSVFTSVECLRFFINDRGETIAERDRYCPGGRATSR